MVPEGVPGELRDDPVVLVGVLAAGTEHDVGGGPAFQALELFLDPRGLRREEAVPEALRGHPQRARRLSERSCARPRFPRADRVAAEDDPVEGDRAALEQVLERPAAADLDVVGVRAEAENAERVRGPARQLEAEHQLRVRKTGWTGPALEKPLDAAVESLAVDGQRAAQRLDRPVDVGVLVRVAHDERRHQDAALDRLLQHERPEGLRRASRRRRGRRRRGCTAVRRPRSGRRRRGPAPPPRCPDWRRCALPVERLDDALLLVDADRLDGRRQGVGLGAVGRREQEDAVLAVAQPAELHDRRAGRRGPTAEKPLAEAFAERRQVRPHAVESLRAPEVPAETGDHLVEDEQGAFGVAKPAQALEVARRRLPRGRRLEDEARDLLRVAPEERLDALEIVEAEARGSGPATLCGIPAAIGVVPMNQSSVEKNGWSLQMATRSRPVAARASLTAAVVTSEPFLANLTMSPGTTREQRLGALHLERRRAREVRAEPQRGGGRLDDARVARGRASPRAGPCRTR